MRIELLTALASLATSVSTVVWAVIHCRIDKRKFKQAGVE